MAPTAHGQRTGRPKRFDVKRSINWPQELVDIATNRAKRMGLPTWTWSDQIRADLYQAYGLVKDTVLPLPQSHSPKSSRG